MTGHEGPTVDRLTSPDGSLEVEVLPELGARLHRLRAFGHDLLRTPPTPAVHLREGFFWGGYVMAPWCNRLATGALAVGSRTVDLPASFPDGTAIHGQVHLRPWQRLGPGDYRVDGGGDGWPWRYEVRSRITVADGAVGIELALANRSDDPMPAGIGLHPWFRRPLRLAIHAPRVHPSNLASEPRPEPVVGPLDLRTLGDPAPGLDGTWTDPGDPAAELAWPDAGVRATLRVEATGPVFVVAATPPDIDAVAVEPETHAPQGLRRLLGGEPGGLAWLEPGSRLVLTIGLEIAGR